MIELSSKAQTEAHWGRFELLSKLAAEVLGCGDSSVEALLDVGALLQSFGFCALAEQCFSKAQTAAPLDLRGCLNLANLAQSRAEHAKARQIYMELLALQPHNPIFRRNALTGLEYDPAVPEGQRLAQARDWGRWAIARAGGPRPRAAMAALRGRALKVGYVGADFCQHTVGLFVKDILGAHDRSRVEVFVYSAGHVKDWVTEQIAATAQFQDVLSLDDATLALQIQQDGIDVLVDLSGHTAGSRLTVFAYRPAPVLVSWLGYFATTGLACIDAVLLDEWHAPAGAESQFAEPIFRLPAGRLCYQPVPWAPAVSSPPFDRNGYLTFGSFNNTAKLNGEVFDTWAKLMHAVPDARLILKWRTFNDERFRQQVLQAFSERKISAERIELRGPSFHADLLEEYGDIDIALDTFPFTGGADKLRSIVDGCPGRDMASAACRESSDLCLPASDWLVGIGGKECRRLCTYRCRAGERPGASRAVA